VSERWNLTEEAEPVPPATITLVQGPSFVICDAGGDIDAPGARSVEGLFVGDTRVCSRLLMRLDGRRLEALAVAPQQSAARAVLNPRDRVIPLAGPGAIVRVVRDRHGPGKGVAGMSSECPSERAGWPSPESCSQSSSTGGSWNT
jgi:hypothetical protein